MDKPNKKREVWAVDLDGTLAHYEPGDIEKYGHRYIGKPIPEMVAKVKAALASGIEVFIFSARTNHNGDEFEEVLESTESYGLILDWVTKVIGQPLPVTHEKLRCFTKFVDDRGEAVAPNTGEFVRDLLEGHIKNLEAKSSPQAR